MNPEAEALLKKILAKEPVELTEYDKEFLLARRSYVGKVSREKFKDVFRESNEVEEEKPVKEVKEHLKKAIENDPVDNLEPPLTQDEEEVPEVLA